jgi:serine/threonine-protein kinase
MKKETSLCMGCMAESKNEFGESVKICAVCGYTKNSVFLSSYLAPTTFLAERYIIGKLISYNGEGAYYIAFDTVSGMKVTVREYMPDTLCGRKKDEEAIEVNPQFVALYKTYLSEFIELNRSLMNIGSSLQTQRVTDVFTENNTVYAVYEYITGISLKSYLSNLGGVLPWEQVKELFTPLFTTLNLVHSAGIVHRGLSPSTILFNDKSELVLINFGITAARTYGSEINHEVFAGYAGPEQYCGKERHGSWTDVYGVSAVLYKVLTGQLPPIATSRKENSGFNSLTEPALINRNVPLSVSAAITKALTLEVDARTRTIGELINGLFEAVPVSVPDSTNEILIKKPTRKQEDSPRQNSYKDSSQGRRPVRSGGSYILPVTGLVLLGLVVIAIITVMLNPDIYDLFTNRNPDVPAVIADDEEEPYDPFAAQPPAPPTNPVNTGDDPQPPVHASELYVIPDFTMRRFELIENDASFEFLSFNPVYEFSDVYANGVIFGQDIAHGTEVTRNTEISITVSMGPSIIPLPPYNGMFYAEYESLLFSMGIKYTRAPGEYNPLAADLVIRCRIDGKDVPAGGNINIEEGDIVTVYYSLGPAPVEAPPDELQEEPFDDEY